jgi:hypothetical protein
MITDKFTRTCLAMIVLLLAIMTYNHNIGIVGAAPPTEYMIEAISEQQAPVVNAHMKKRVAEGWTLHTFGSSYLVWQK